jgi:hypothetical protein
MIKASPLVNPFSEEGGYDEATLNSLRNILGEEGFSELQKIKAHPDEEKIKQDIKLKVFKGITKIKGKRNDIHILHINRSFIYSKPT